MDLALPVSCQVDGRHAFGAFHGQLCDNLAGNMPEREKGWRSVQQFCQKNFTLSAI